MVEVAQLPRAALTVKLSYPSRFQIVPKLSFTLAGGTEAPEGFVVPEVEVTKAVGAETPELHDELHAVTLESSAYPMSLACTVYLGEVAPGIRAQLVPLVLQSRHWYL